MMRTVLSALIAAIVCPAIAPAGIIYSSTNKEEWSSFVNGQFTTIGFTEVFQEIVTEQYADLGVHFTDGDDYGVMQNNFLDGFGIKGHFFNGGTITVEFDSPQMWVAANALGTLRISLYLQDAFLASKSTVIPGVGNKFSGVVSDVMFDKIIFEDVPQGGLPVIDDLHFGGPIPAPGVLAVFFGKVGLRTGRRRRMQ